MCPDGQIWSPVPGTTWQWQLQGTIDMSFDVQMYDIDLFDNDASTIASLHAQGRAVICYFSTQYENWRPDSADFPASVLGHALDGWPGENYVDITSPIVRSIMTARLDLAVTKGCDGVEPDNVDEYENDNGLGITAADQIDFNTFIASNAHSRGLSVGLKNDLDQVTQLESYYDWALDEQCNQYSECGTLKPFTQAGKAVFGTEYQGSAATFCPKMVADQYSWLLKSLDLTANPTTECCTYATGGCAVKPAFTCQNPTARRTMYAPQNLTQHAMRTVQYEEKHSAASVLYPTALVAAVALALLF